MKAFKDIFHLITILNICIYIFMGCQSHDDNAYFNGEIRYIDDDIEDCEDVKLESIYLEGANHGWIAVYDSLMFFLNPKLTDTFYQVFNINTGKEIGTFCHKGNGPAEVVCLGPIFQFFKEGDELKTLLFAPNEEKFLIWNISQSISQHKTMIDKITPYAWRKEHKNAAYNHMFLQDKDILLTKVDAVPINDECATLPYYQKRTVNSNKLLRNYKIYKDSIINGETSVIPESFFSSNDAFKPDGTKVVQAMVHLPQLNIIDVNSGKVVGVRLKSQDDFSVFKGKKQISNYYIRVQADNNYIYALYWGKVPWGHNEIPYLNIIYVFDWDGKLIRKISMDHSIDKMWIDPVRNRLYIIGPKDDEVYYCELSKV